MSTLKRVRPDECWSFLERCFFRISFRQIGYHSVFVSECATTSPHTGDCIDSTSATQSPFETCYLAPPDCAATSPFAVPLTTHRNCYQRWGVPDELWVKEAVQRSIHMSSFQQRICLKCGRYPAAGNQLRRCESCHAVKYCSSGACQTEDWASHRLAYKKRHTSSLNPLLFN